MVSPPTSGPPGPARSALLPLARELGIPEDEAGRRVQPRDEPAGEQREGVMIASHRALDELSLVHDHPSVSARQGTVLGWYVGENRQRVPASAARDVGR